LRKTPLVWPAATPDSALPMHSAAAPSPSDCRTSAKSIRPRFGAQHPAQPRAPSLSATNERTEPPDLQRRVHAAKCCQCLRVMVFDEVVFEPPLGVKDARVVSFSRLACLSSLRPALVSLTFTLALPVRLT
jgi:hypothetical protein